MTATELSTDHLVVRLDPDRGATIDHIGTTARDRDNVLALYDWATPLPARQGPGYGSSAADWLSEYRGGWQLLAPSGGAECVVNDVTHPFHGEVSRAVWTVTEESSAHVTLTVGTHSPIVVTRTLQLDATRPRLLVTTTMTNESPVPAPAIAIEHIAFAGSDDAQVSAPASSLWQHDPNVPEAASNDGVMEWAQSGLQAPIARGGYRLTSLLSGSEGWIELHRPGRVVRLEWDPQSLPHLWHWQERGSTRFPWFARADITALEPSSVSFSDGLAAAIDRGEAWMIEPEQSQTIEVALEITAASEGQEGGR